MANNAFDRTIINLRERPLSSDINQAQSQADRSLRELCMQAFTAKASGTSPLAGNPVSGFIGQGFRVVPSSPLGLSVVVSAGLGFQDLPADVVSAFGGVTGVDDLARYKPLSLLADVTLSGIPAGPSAGNTRYDIVEVRMNRVSGNSLSRDSLDPITGLFVPGLLNKTLAFTQDGSIGMVSAPASSTAAISYKVGVVNGGEPTTTTGYVKIATIYSNNGNMTTQVTRANVIERRSLLAPYGMVSFFGSVSVPTGAASPPSSLLFRAPPGVECCITKTAQPANNQFEIYLLGPVVGACINCGIAETYAAGSFYHAQYLSVSAGGLSTGQVAALASTTLTGNPLTLPEGYPYVSTAFALHRQNGATTDGTVPDPALVTFQGSIQT